MDSSLLARATVRALEPVMRGIDFLLVNESLLIGNTRLDANASAKLKLCTKATEIHGQELVLITSTVLYSLSTLKY